MASPTIVYLLFRQHKAMQFCEQQTYPKFFKGGIYMTGENQMYMPVAPAYGMGGDMFGGNSAW